MMLVPTIFYSAGLLGRAPLFEGDTRKEMTCITCDGLGRTGKEESCPSCRGRGVADFIIPGPNRPVQLVGTVKDSAGQPVKGAEVRARQAEGDQTEVLLESNQDGQFGIKLPPGAYVISVAVEGKGSVSESLLIEPQTEPIPARGAETLHKFEKEFLLAK